MTDLDFFRHSIANGRLPKNYRFYAARPMRALWADAPALPATPAFCSEGDTQLDRVYLSGATQTTWR